VGAAEHLAQAAAAPVRGEGDQPDHGLGRRRLGRALLHERRWQDLAGSLIPAHQDHPSFKYLSDDELDALRARRKLYDDIFLNDVFFADDKNGWMAGEYGHTYWTDDGGETWNHGHIAGTVKFDEIVFSGRREEGAEGQVEQIFAATEILLDKPYLKIEMEG
jgi:hypothetical protein